MTEQKHTSNATESPDQTHSALREAQLMLEASRAKTANDPSHARTLSAKSEYWAGIVHKFMSESVE